MGKKQTAAETDGVQYRRAKLWQIILYACNALPGMGVYMLIGMASYSASIGYGIASGHGAVGNGFGLVVFSVDCPRLWTVGVVAGWSWRVAVRLCTLRDLYVLRSPFRPRTGRKAHWQK